MDYTIIRTQKREGTFPVHLSDIEPGLHDYNIKSGNNDKLNSWVCPFLISMNYPYFSISDKISVKMDNQLHCTESTENIDPNVFLDPNSIDPLLKELRNYLEEHKNNTQNSSTKHSYGSRDRKSKFTNIYIPIKWLIEKLYNPTFETQFYGKISRTCDGFILDISNDKFFLNKILITTEENYKIYKTTQIFIGLTDQNKKNERSIVVKGFTSKNKEELCEILAWFIHCIRKNDKEIIKLQLCDESEKPTLKKTFNEFYGGTNWSVFKREIIENKEKIKKCFEDSAFYAFKINHIHS